MPDGSNLSRIVGDAHSAMPRPMTSRSERMEACNRQAGVHPLDAGTITHSEHRQWMAYKKALDASYTKGKPVEGPAEFGALHAAALLSADLMRGRIFCDSIRYASLVARHELDWARQRGGKRRTKSERVAASLIEASQALSKACSAYRPYSRFTRTLAADCRDQHGYERNIAISRDERRRLLLDARSRHTFALRKLLALIDAYKAVRWPTEHSSRPEAVLTH